MKTIYAFMFACLISFASVANATEEVVPTGTESTKVTESTKPKFVPDSYTAEMRNTLEMSKYAKFDSVEFLKKLMDAGPQHSATIVAAINWLDTNNENWRDADPKFKSTTITRLWDRVEQINREFANPEAVKMIVDYFNDELK